MKMREKVIFASTSFMVIGLMFTALSSAKLDPETIVGIWLFDEGAGKVARDASENGIDGKFEGAPKWVKGKFGMALELDGAKDWINMGNDPILKPETNGDGHVTFMAWYKWEGGRYVLSTGGQTSSTGVAITHDPGAGKIWFGVNTGKNSASTDYTAHEEPGKGWHHLAGSYDDAKGELVAYIDGKVLKKVKAAPKPLADTWQELHIGKPNNVANYFINATIDEVAIFNVPLSEADINTIMTKGIEAGALAVSPSGKLAAAWGAMKAQ
jgi:hypothetical protein